MVKLLINLKVASKISRHITIKKKNTKQGIQKKQTEEIKEGEAIIHVDFSENYKNKQQNQIISVYYVQGQFSL